jgi:hypothetical protein
LSNTFPPKFSQNILYPAVYNLDKFPMPTGEISDGYPPGDIGLGSYFNVSFENLSTINSTPSLSYGKHVFKITLVQGSIGSLPRLRVGSRILFEFKDANGTILFSDTTTLHSDIDFSGYVWLKEDPLRTYNSIVQGTGKMTIVGITDTNDSEWRKRYNVRSELPVNINLYNSDLVLDLNHSPILFQNNTGSMYGGIFIEESTRISQATGYDQSIAVISASRMKTYSGTVSSIQVEFKLSGSEDEWTANSEWTGLSNHILKSASYEDGIDAEYSFGINTLSEQFTIPILSEQIPHNDNTLNKVKFKLRFKDPVGNYATDPHSPAEEHYIEYPSGSNDWLDFEGSIVELPGHTVFRVSKPVIAESTVGQFSFYTEGHAVIKGSALGQTFDENGKLSTSGGGGAGGGRPVE